MPGIVMHKYKHDTLAIVWWHSGLSFLGSLWRCKAHAALAAQLYLRCLATREHALFMLYASSRAGPVCHHWIVALAVSDCCRVYSVCLSNCSVCCTTAAGKAACTAKRYLLVSPVCGVVAFVREMQHGLHMHVLQISTAEQHKG